MRKVFLGLFVVLAVTCFVFLFVPSHKSTANVSAFSNVSAAKEVASHYVQAVKSKDVAGMMATSHDIRFQDEKQRKKEYQQLVKNQSVQDLEVTTASNAGDSLVMVTMEWDEGGKRQVMTVPVYKENGQWKVIVGGSRS